jgi:hypothetical protein
VSADFTVTIIEQGRAGTIVYREGAMELALWWELTMNGAYIWAPTPEQWDAHWQASAPAAAGHRAEILARVAAEAVRQRAKSARTSIGDDGISLTF